MATIGTVVQFRLSNEVAVNYGEGQLGADVGDPMAALVVSEPTGSPATCNLKVWPNSGIATLFVEGAAEGTDPGEWQELA